MTRLELMQIAEETAKKMFSDDKFIVTVTPIVKGNGAHICVEEIIPAHDNRVTEYYQVGFNLSVYAIAGKDNIINKIKRSYARYAA